MYVTDHAFSLSIGLGVTPYIVSFLGIDTQCIYSDFSYVISKKKKSVVRSSKSCANLTLGEDLMCHIEKIGTVVNKVFFIVLSY